MLSLKIAARFLFSSKLQTLLIMLGIGVGVSVQVFIGSLIGGLQNDLIDSTIGSQSHITIRSQMRDERLSVSPSFLSEVEDISSEIRAVSSVLEGPGTIDNDVGDSIFIRGFEFERANDIYRFDEALISGDIPEHDGVLIGKDLAEMLAVEIGEQVRIVLPQQGFDTFTFEISGIFDLGVASVNETWFVMRLETAQTLFDTNQVSAVEMQVNDVFATTEIAERLMEAYPDLRHTEWQASNQELLSGLEGQSISSLMIQVFVMISLVLGIASVLAITVLQKSRQLGILKAMGITDFKASTIFLAQGFILGVFGALIGVGLGLFLNVAFTQFAVNPDGTPVVSLQIDPAFVMLSALVAITASLLASIIPAKRSAKLSIIEVIRNG